MANLHRIAGRFFLRFADGRRSLVERQDCSRVLALLLVRSSGMVERHRFALSGLLKSGHAEEKIGSGGV